MKFAISLLSLFCAASCGNMREFKTPKKSFSSSADIGTYKAIADMNDSYFVIKENNFFEFYMQLFDSVKNTSYPGTYKRNGDTLHLHFYNSRGKLLLGSNALINAEKKEVIFYDKKPGQKKKPL